jgi:drug/metabolite transporter (DMT)-like permease
VGILDLPIEKNYFTDMNPRLQNSLFFIIPSLIWGSTWYAIKFQLGSVDPLMSVAYRFFMAGSILVLFCLLFKHNMRFGYKNHLLFLLQGVLLFGVNYWLVYMAERELTSGLIAVIFSLVVITNAVFGAIFIRSKITWKLAIGGILAISGTALIFEKEIGLLFGGSFVLSAIIMSFTSLILASLGNVLSAYSQKKAIPLLQANAYSMIYGAVVVFIIGLVIGREVTFDMDYPYIISLSYLAIFGSVIAFSSYLKIVGSIGPAKASYALVLVPLIAMVFSTIFESYEWQASALWGLPILIIGNMIAMDKLKPEVLFKKWK